jgi:acyl-CoA thioester hydrolase
VTPVVHTHTFMVAMSEVDASQIHFTALFRWMDRGLSEWLALVGRPFTRLLVEGPGIPIVDARAQFAGRIMLDDTIALQTFISGIGRTSFRSRHTFRRDAEVVATGELVHVCVDRATRETIVVPDWLREVAVPGDVTGIPAL